MKATKLILSILFIFSSVEGFSQTIEDTAICTTIGSKASFTVDYPTASTYEWQVKISGLWTTITALNSGAVYSGYTSSTLNITKSLTSPVTGTLYRVKVIDGFNISTYSNEAELIIDPVPISKTISGASPVCAGGSKTLTYGTGSVGTIQWQSSTISSSEGFNDISGETELVYLATDLQKTTWFRVMNTNDICSSYSPAVQVLVNPLAVPVFVDLDSEFKVRAFPNPFETEFNINLTRESLDPIELKIYDMLGRLIENHQVKSSEINSMRIGTTYPSGFFTVLIKQGQQERNVKVLKK